MYRYSKDYYREQFQSNSTEKLLFQYANLELNKEASEAIYEILTQRGEVVAHKDRAQGSPKVPVALTGCFAAFAAVALLILGIVLWFLLPYLF